MTSRDLHPDDGPELLPPAELLRLRAELARPPGPELRARHLAATAMAARQLGNSPMGRFASRSARGAVAIVAALAITSGLAGAQLLPEQAQRLLSNVSDRFAPSDDSDPPAEPATPGDATTTLRSATDDPAPEDDGPADVTTSTTATATATTDEPVVGPGTTSVPTSVTTSPPSPTDTTIPGPAGPGSPDDPTDPDPTTTTTAPPTTTTTQPPTTTTTQPSTTTTTGGGTP